MTFFESLLVLLLAAVVLLQIARKFALPYPAMLAAAGVAVAFIPGAPTFRIDPETTLALFIAPVLFDAAYDFPLATARTLWRPLIVLAAGAVLVTTATVAFIGVWAAGLPTAAAIVLGAIVAPPDAAAAVAVLGTVSIPRRTVSVLKGESLFNDAVALLLFNGALTVQAEGVVDWATAAKISIAIPGGILLGIVLGFAMLRLSRYLTNTLGGNLLQFLNAFLVWIIAERLHLSAVLAIVACAMTVEIGQGAMSSARMRQHSFAVWASVVFLLNVLAFLLMGMQARMIITSLPAEQLREAGLITGLVILAVVATRFAYVMFWNRLAVRFPGLRGNQPKPTYAQGVVVSWSGMRGLVTLAAAFALPSNFPQRDLVVLVAFGVVLATLVVQGLTLAPLIRLLKLDRMEDTERALISARRDLARAAFGAVSGAPEGDDLALSQIYRHGAEAKEGTEAHQKLKNFRQLGLSAVTAQRLALRQMRDDQLIDVENYLLLQEEIDWRELTLLPDKDRRIDEV